MLKMAIIDWVIIGILAISTVSGAVRGAIKELLALAIWGLAVFVIFFYSETLAEQLPFLANKLTPILRVVIAGILLLVVTILMGAIVKYLVNLLVEASGLEGTDRTLGTVFGLLRGALIVMVILIFLPKWLAVQGASWWQASVLIPYFQAFEADALVLFNSVIGWFK